MFGCAVTTGFGVIENNAKGRIGESVVIFGAGGVGLNIVQAASLVGAYPIIAVDLYDNRLALAKEMGATHLINSSRVDAKLGIDKVVGNLGLDVFVDNTGQPKIIELGYQITKPQGRVVLVGVPRKGNEIQIYSLSLHFGKVISGSHGGEADPSKDIGRYMSLIKAREINLKSLITERHPLDSINTAIENMKSGKSSGRCSIVL